VLWHLTCESHPPFGRSYVSCGGPYIASDLGTGHPILNTDDMVCTAHLAFVDVLATSATVAGIPRGALAAAAHPCQNRRVTPGLHPYTLPECLYGMCPCVLAPRSAFLAGLTYLHDTLVMPKIPLSSVHVVFGSQPPFGGKSQVEIGCLTPPAPLDIYFTECLTRCDCTVVLRGVIVHVLQVTGPRGRGRIQCHVLKEGAAYMYIPGLRRS
jgi:hypothetical protein